MALRFLDFSSHRQKDENGYLIVKNNPIAKAGVFEYLMSEINPNSQDESVFKVYRPFDTLLKIKDSFANKPIKYEHEWVGKDGAPQADGAIGSIIMADEKNGYLKADLIIYNPALIEAIENGMVELSPAYIGECKEQAGRFEGNDYQFIQEVGCVNHLAVVEKGRSGFDLRILDTKNKLLERKKMAKSNFLDAFSKHIQKFLDNADENLNKVEDTMDDLAKSILEIAKSEGEEADKIAKIAELLGNKTQDNDNATQDEGDNEGETQDEGETPTQDEGNATNDNEGEKTCDNDEGEKAKDFLDSIDKLITARLKAFESSKNTEFKKIQDSYAEVSKVLGAFDYQGKSANEIYKLGFETLTNNTLGEGIDAKSAFKTALNLSNLKFSDSKVSEPQNSESKILEMLKSM